MQGPTLHPPYCVLAGENIGSRFVGPTAGCVDIVVHLESEPDGSRRVREIVAVPGRVGGEVVELEPIFLRRGNRLRRADGHPPHVDRFGRAGIDPAGLLAVSDGDREGVAWWVR
jgi:pilus assembly protein CpaF